MKRIGVENEETYQKTMEADLEKLGARVNEIQEKAERLGGEAKAEFNKWKEELGLKQGLATERLDNLKYVTGDIWKNLREGFEKSAADLKESIERALPKIESTLVINPAIA
ncbi:MAG: sll1863 family stress response protein [Nitrospiria bacterium]